MALYIDRHIEQQIIVASKHYPVIMVCGQQQVGKSTMLNHIKGEHRRYVTLDDGNSHRLASADPALFFETYGAPLLIDEIQRVPSLLLEMKQIVDEKALAGEYTRGIFWITGSQKFQMMKDVSESLAGRIAVFDPAGLSSAEIENRPAALFDPSLDSLRQRLATANKKDMYQIYETIFRGSMPRLITTDIDRDRYYIAQYDYQIRIHIIPQIGSNRIQKI